MSSRSAMLWPLIIAAALGGCAHDPLDWTEPSALIDQDRRAEPRAETVAASSSADVIITRAEAAQRDRTSGYIVEAPWRQKPYLLDTGDRLRIFVYGQPNLSRLYTVDQSGSVSVPLIGAVRARGLTTYQLEGAIRSRLGRELVRDPQVTVDVQQNRPFFILGEVRNAGQYPYVTGMTIEMAVATAGGYGERANERKARLSRRNGGITEIVEVSPETEIEPGDTVYVFERYF